MAAGMHVHNYPAGAPSASLNAVSLDKGELLVTVSLGDRGGSYLSFNAPEEIAPWVEALTRAYQLAQEGAGQIEVARAVAEAAAEEDAQ